MMLFEDSRTPDGLTTSVDAADEFYFVQYRVAARAASRRGKKVFFFSETIHGVDTKNNLFVHPTPTRSLAVERSVAVPVRVTGDVAEVLHPGHDEGNHEQADDDVGEDLSLLVRLLLGARDAFSATVFFFQNVS